jgi:hypothetical protein
MCPPIIAAVAAAAPATQAALALGAVSTGLQIRGQQIQAKTQRRVQANASKVERQRYLNEVSSLRTQQAQEQVALAQKLQANKRKAMEAQSTATVSAGEAGVAGLSVDALRNDLAAKEARYNNSVSTQAQMLDVRRNLALRDAGLGFTNNMLRINRPIQEVDYAGALMSGAKTGLSTYSVLKDAGVGRNKTPSKAIPIDYDMDFSFLD